MIPRIATITLSIVVAFTPFFSLSVITSACVLYAILTLRMVMVVFMAIGTICLAHFILLAVRENIFTSGTTRLAYLQFRIRIDEIQTLQVSAVRFSIVNLRINVVEVSLQAYIQLLVTFQVEEHVHRISKPCQLHQIMKLAGVLLHPQFHLIRC